MMVGALNAAIEKVVRRGLVIRVGDMLVSPRILQTDRDAVKPSSADNTQKSLHDLLHTVCRHLPTDFEPYGERERNTAADCSCGCCHFLKLPDRLGEDWGVCINPRSPRSGLLTFEHQGCEQLEQEPDGDP